MTEPAAARPLTGKDEALIRLLQEDARAPLTQLARRLGVSRTAVRERLQRLVDRQVIQGFTVKMTPAWQQQQIRAFIAMTIDPRHARRVIRALEQMPRVSALWTVSGRLDLLAEASAATTEQIDRLLDDVGDIEGISRTESSVVLSTRFERR